MEWRQACFSHGISAKFYIHSSLFLNKAPSLYCLRLSSEMHPDRFFQSCEYHITYLQSYEAIGCSKATFVRWKESQNTKLVQIPLLKPPPENRITVTVRSQKRHQACETSAWPHCTCPALYPVPAQPSNGSSGFMLGVPTLPLQHSSVTAALLCRWERCDLQANNVFGAVLAIEQTLVSDDFWSAILIMTFLTYMM